MRPYGPTALRLCVGAVFLAHGAQKLFGLWGGPGLSGTTAFFTSLGLPYPYPLALLVAVTEFAGGALLVLGGLTRWVALAIFLFLIPTTLIFHNFWAVDAAQVQAQTIQFMKNLAIMGGLLYVMAFGAGPLSLDNPRP